MRITKLLIRITLYLSNSNRAQSEISCSCCFSSWPLTWTLTLYPSCCTAGCWNHAAAATRFSPAQELQLAKHSRAKHQRSGKYRNKDFYFFLNSTNLLHQNHNVASSRKRNRNHAITWDIYSHLRAARCYEDMHTCSIYCKSTLLNNTTKIYLQCLYVC